MSEPHPSPGSTRPPRPLELARGERTAGPSWAWLLPVLAAVLVTAFGWQAWRSQGLTVTVRAAEGHGIRVGDALRYRGITVGEVRGVRLAPDAREILLVVLLEPEARELARAGSRFWIVRPHVSLDEVAGLETLVGARYLTCLPGPPDAPLETAFVALAEPPVIGSGEPGGLEIRLEAERRQGLRRGAPLSYRGVEIGRVLEVDLSGDGTAVEVRAQVLPDYVGLVRADSRFWEVSGVEVSLGLTGGLSIRLESLRALLVGGIALATPTLPGDPARVGQVFKLHPEPEREWLEWRPPIPIGREVGEDDVALPRPHAARRTFKARRYLARQREVVGLVLRDGDSLVGPADLLAPPGGRSEVDPSLWVDGQALGVGVEVLATAGGAVRIAAPGIGLPDSGIRARRPLGDPEPCLVVGVEGARPLALDPARLEAGEGDWRVAQPVRPGGAWQDGAWHGAPVVARRDGAWIGVLLVEGRQARVVPVP